MRFPHVPHPPFHPAHVRRLPSLPRREREREFFLPFLPGDLGKSGHIHTGQETPVEKRDKDRGTFFGETETPGSVGIGNGRSSAEEVGGGRGGEN